MSLPERLITALFAVLAVVALVLLLRHDIAQRCFQCQQGTAAALKGNLCGCGYGERSGMTAPPSGPAH